MAKIALIGASGQAGSRILKELSDRGHVVTGIARNPEKIALLPNVIAARGDAFDQGKLADLIAAHDAVISSVHFTASDPRILIEAVRASGVPRYLIVGGAGGLEIAPGKRVFEQPDFPEAYKQEARAGAEFLDLLRAEPTLNWTFLSPSAEFVPGERTGTFRLGNDTLLSNDQGSSISFEDYAIALVDEIERPAHIRERFTIGY